MWGLAALDDTVAVEYFKFLELSRYEDVRLHSLLHVSSRPTECRSRITCKYFMLAPTTTLWIKRL